MTKNGIPLELDSKKVFDIEKTRRISILLKGVGRYCRNPQCNNHLFGKSTQEFCSARCRWKVNGQKKTYKHVAGLQAFIYHAKHYHAHAFLSKF